MAFRLIAKLTLTDISVALKVGAITGDAENGGTAVISEIKKASLFAAVVLFFVFPFSIQASDNSESDVCTDYSDEIADTKKRLVRLFVCESFEIRPCAVRVSAVTRCGSNIGFIVVWARPDEHPAQSWLVEWSGNTLHLNLSE